MKEHYRRGTVGTWSRVRAWHTAALGGLVLAACVACGSGGGGNIPSKSGLPRGVRTPAASTGRPGTVSAVAVEKNPCLFDTLSDARRILGPAAALFTAASTPPSASPSEPASTQASCAYDITGSTTLVQVNVGMGTPAVMESVFLPSGGAPVAAVGHGAACGAESGISGGYSLVAALTRGYVVVVSGPSCAVDAQFAEAGYSRLAT
jgi:hypothetical protein